MLRVIRRTSVARTRSVSPSYRYGQRRNYVPPVLRQTAVMVPAAASTPTIAAGDKKEYKEDAESSHRKPKQTPAVPWGKNESERLLMKSVLYPKQRDQFLRHLVGSSVVVPLNESTQHQYKYTSVGFPFIILKYDQEMHLPVFTSEARWREYGNPAWVSWVPIDMQYVIELMREYQKLKIKVVINPNFFYHDVATLEELETHFVFIEYQQMQEKEQSKAKAAAGQQAKEKKRGKSTQPKSSSSTSSLPSAITPATAAAPAPVPPPSSASSPASAGASAVTEAHRDLDQDKVQDQDQDKGKIPGKTAES